jgi:hypothetical protein
VLLKKIRNTKWYIIIFIIILLLAVPISNVVIEALNEAICDNTVSSQQDSPDSNYVVYNYKRNCGATSDEFYNVSVYSKRQGLSAKRGNIAYADKPLKVTWKNKKLIEISYLKDTNFYKQNKNYKDIKIKYISS